MNAGEKRDTQEWWPIPIIPAFRRLEQKDGELEVCPSSTESPCSERVGRDGFANPGPSLVF